MTIDSKKKTRSLVYADAVKEEILNSPKLFVNDDDVTSVLFEKALDLQFSGYSIADCLVFSEQKGIIGIEIKTAHDSKTRLRRQLGYYSNVCDYVWVFIHDTIFPEVADILEDFYYVGIICYQETENAIYPGIIRQAIHNPQVKLKSALSILWSVELWELIKKVNPKHPYKYQLKYQWQRIDYLLKQDPERVKQFYIEMFTRDGLNPDRGFSIYDFRRKS